LALAGALVVCVLGAPGAARAEHPEAKRLFEEGRGLAEQGNYPEACARYAKSYELERAPGTALNLGDCAEREGKLGRAWQLYDTAAALFEKEKKPARVKFARVRADLIEPKLATVVVRLAKPGVPGLLVRIGDHTAPTAGEVVERLDPGEVPVLVSAPGHAPFQTAVTAAGGERVVVAVPALQRLPGVPEPVDRSATHRRRSRVVLAAGVTGAGVLAIGAAAVVGLSADSLYDAQFRASGGAPPACTAQADGPSLCTAEGLSAVNRARDRSSLATYIGIGGGALLVTGAVLYFTAPRERVTVAPIASPGTLGLALGGRF
jgi:hypothetical protein